MALTKIFLSHFFSSNQFSMLLFFNQKHPDFCKSTLVIQQNKQKQERRMGNCASTNDIAETKGSADLSYYASKIKEPEGSELKNGEVKSDKMKQEKLQKKELNKSSIKKIIQEISKTPDLPPPKKDCCLTILAHIEKEEKNSGLKVGLAYQNMMLYNHAIQHYLKYEEGEDKDKIKLQLAQCFSSISKYQESLQKYLEIQRSIELNYGESSTEYIKLLINKGVCYFSLCRMSEAQQTYELAYDIIKKHNKLKQAECCLLFSNLIELYINKGDFEMIIKIVKESMQIISQLQPTLSAVQAILDLRNVYLTLDCGILTQELLTMCEAIIKQKVGTESLEFIHLLMHEIMLAKQYNQLEQCEALMQTCEEKILKVLGKKSFPYVELKSEEGLFYLGQYNIVKAIKCFNQSIQILTQLQEQYNLIYPLILVNKIVAYLKIESYQKIQQLCQQSYRFFRSFSGDCSVQAVQVGTIYGQTMYQHGKDNEALDAFQQVKLVYEKLNLSQCGNYVKTLANIGLVLTTQSKHAQAIQQLKKALEFFQNESKINPIFIQICCCLANNYESLKQEEEEKKYSTAAQQASQRMEDIKQQLRQCSLKLNSHENV